MQGPDYTPLYIRIQNFLREEIRAGRLNEGDKTPSEPELCDLFSTTRATVAKALQQLVFDGTIIRRPGSGTFVASRPLVAPIDPTRVRSFEEQVAKAGDKISYQVIGFAPSAATEAEAELLHLETDLSVHRLTRLRLLNEKPLSIEFRVFPAELGALLTEESLTEKSVHRLLNDQFRLAVHRVEGRIRCGLAKGMVADRLRLETGAPLIIRDYVLLSKDRRPLVCGESVYREEFRIDYIVQEIN